MPGVTVLRGGPMRSLLCLSSGPAATSSTVSYPPARSPAARAKILRQAEQILLDDVVVVPGYFGVARNLVSSQVSGFVDNNVNIHRTRFVSLNRSIRTV